MSDSQTGLEGLDFDFDPNHVRDWAYQAADGKILPYGAGINYFSRGLSISRLAEVNMGEARAAKLSETGYSLGANGVYVGFARWDSPEAEKPTQMKFETPVPLDESMSGDQPPITGFYPRVVFPPEGRFRYALLVRGDEGVFGTGFENHTLEIPCGTSPNRVDVPKDVPCERAVRGSLSEFLEGFDEPWGLPEGEYNLNMEIERMPLLAVRIDGYRPLASKIRVGGQIPKELPLADRSPHGSFDYKAYDLSRPAPRENPLERRIFPDEKYIEIPFVLSSGLVDGWTGIGMVTLEHDGVEDTADLVYVPIRRSESIEETATNPHFGLVEVQVSRVAKVNGVDIEYKPKKVERPKSPLDELRGSLSDDFGGSLRSCSLFDTGKSSGFRSTTTPVNTGRTEFANARTGAVSPKVDAEWDRHITTFRLCLTNNL